MSMQRNQPFPGVPSPTLDGRAWIGRGLSDGLLVQVESADPSKYHYLVFFARDKYTEQSKQPVAHLSLPPNVDQLLCRHGIKSSDLRWLESEKSALPYSRHRVEADE